MSRKLIVSNQVRCHACGDEPFSSHRHDFRACKCGNVYVDGGDAYLRRVGGSKGYTELSIELPVEAVDAAIDAVKWADETGRNERGVAYAVFRALRDNGVDLNAAASSK